MKVARLSNLSYLMCLAPFSKKSRDKLMLAIERNKKISNAEKNFSDSRRRTHASLTKEEQLSRKFEKLRMRQQELEDRALALHGEGAAEKAAEHKKKVESAADLLRQQMAETSRWLDDLNQKEGELRSLCLGIWKDEVDEHTSAILDRDRSIKQIISDVTEQLNFRSSMSAERKAAELSLSMTKRALSESLRIEQRLIAQIQDSVARQARMLEASVEVDREIDLHTEQQPDKQVSRSADLNEKLVTQVSHTNSLIAEVELKESVLRKIDDKLWFEKQETQDETIIKLRRKNGRMARDYFERLEKQVEKREQQAAQQIDYRESVDPSIVEMTAKFDAVLDRICRPFQCVSSLISDVSDRIVSADPSVDNSFERLCTSFRNVRKLAKSSAEEEECLEASFATVQQKIKKSDAYTTECLSKTGGEQIESVRMTLESIRLSNANVDQWIFRVEKLVCRFFVLKTLLGGVTGTPSEVVAEYKTLVNNLCKLMGSMFKENLSPSDEEPTVGIEFNERIEALERKVLMAYLTLARGELSSRSAARTKKKIDSVSVDIAIRLSEQKLDLQKWSYIADMAGRQNLPLALSIASWRTEQCAKLVRHLEQCMDVLSSSYRFIDFKTSSPTSRLSVRHQSE